MCKTCGGCKIKRLSAKKSNKRVKKLRKMGYRTKRVIMKKRIR